MPKAKSQAQAGFFGLIKSGKVKKKGFSASEAGKRLKGVKVKSLPKRVRRRGRK